MYVSDGRHCNRNNCHERPDSPFVFRLRVDFVGRRILLARELRRIVAEQNERQVTTNMAAAKARAG